MKTWAEINAKKYGEIAMSMIQAANLNLKNFAQEACSPSFRVVHLPTQDYFAFGGEDGGASWTRPGYPGKTTQTGRGNFESWEAKIGHFEEWLGKLQEFLAAIEEHSRYEQMPASAPELPQPSTATRLAAGDRPAKARTVIEPTIGPPKEKNVTLFLGRAANSQARARKGDRTLLQDPDGALKESVSFEHARSYLGVSRRQVERLVYEKKSLAIIGGGHNKRITVASLLAYLPAEKATQSE